MATRFLTASLLVIGGALLGGCADFGAGDEGDDTTAAASADGAEDGADRDAAADGQEDDDGNRPRQAVRGGREVRRETPVVVGALEVGPVRDEIVVSSRVEARTSVQVFPKLSNLPILEVRAEEGDRVQAGDVLMTLYDTELRLAEQTAKSRLDEANKTVESRQLLLDQESRRVLRAERQHKNAVKEFERLEGLGEQGLVTKKEVDDARLAAETAEDDASLAVFAQRDADIALQLAVIAGKQAEIDWERARTDLEHAQVRAPISGVVAERQCDVGELTNLTTHAFRLVDSADLVLNLRVPQDAMGELAAGQPVDVRAISAAAADYRGVVRTVNPVLDADSGSVRVIVDLAPAPGLVPGLFCEASIVTSARDDALLVTKRAVLYEDDQPVIFSVTDDESSQARKIKFVAGVSTPDAVEILSDLDGNPVPTDLRIIVVGQENLKDGSPIRIVEEAF